MRSYLRIFILLIISLFAHHSGFAANSANTSSYTSEHITTLDGLIQNDAKCLVEDSMGYIWIGTNDGLCRYDSHKFKRFAKGDLGLESNLITSLEKDRKDNIWISSIDQGLFCYVRSKCRFYPISSLLVPGEEFEPIIMHKLCVDQQTSDNPLIDIWGYNLKSGIIYRFIFDSNKERILSVKQYDECGETGALVDIKFVNGELICASRNSGLYRYSKGSDSFERVYKEQTAGKSIHSITSCGQRLFISTYRDVISIDLITGVTQSKRLDILPKLIMWSGTRLWIVANNGTYTITHNASSSSFGEVECVERFKICDPKSIIEDHCGAIWVGFFKAGVRRYDNKGEFIKMHTGFGNDFISYIFNDSKQRLWIGTDGSGLYLQPDHDMSVKPVQILPQCRVYAVAESEANDAIYASTNQKLFQFDRSNPSSASAKVLLDNPSIYNILPIGNTLYLASYNYGMLKLNLQDGSLVELTMVDGLPSLVVRNMMMDSRGDMWICTSQGVAKIKRDQLNMARPKIERIPIKELENCYTISITEDHRGDIWCGTLGDGLFRAIPKADETYEVTQFTTEQSLPNNSIKAILEDNNNAIWVSTNRGLSRLTFGAEREVVNISGYNIDDGLQDYEFNELAAIKLPSGALLFGGVGGINSFIPRELRLDESEALPAITDFSVNFKSIFSDDELNRNIASELYSDEGFKLRHNQNSISIEFASIHHTNPTKNQYQYMLQGADKEWISGIDGVREVNYSTLSPGIYNFCLRAANSDGVWNKSQLILPITIRHPFWSDWYAILIYIIFVVMIGVYTVFYYKDLLKRRNSLSLIKLEKQKAEEILELRSKLFTNISHEFRTPLTLIASSIERLGDTDLAEPSGERSEYLSTIRFNGEVLMRLINEVMNFSKIENGHSLEAKLTQGDIVRSTTHLFTQFKSWAEQRNISLQIETPNHPVIVEHDHHLWEQAIYNIISNAMKHTPRGGEITLRITQSQSEVQIEVSDTGEGIEEARREYVFTRFFSASSTSSQHIGGTGVGLYLTRQIILLHSGEITFDSSTTQGESGTTFRVKLPLQSEQQQVSRSDDMVPTIETLDTPKSHEAERVEIAELYGSRPTMLIVDDSPEIVNLLCNIFKREYNTLRAEDGRIALSIAEQRSPDIILSDVMMPNMDGYELCDAIKRGSNTSHIPVILLSAKSDADDIAKGLRLTADAYCTKPFNNRVLFELVATTLINRRRSAIAFGASRSVFDPNGEREIENADQIFLRRVNDYILSNIEKSDLKAEEICRELSVTQFLLNKKLRALSDMTINAYIRKVRLIRASELLAEGGRSVGEVTYSVGFSDLRYFRECFKREFGILPTQVKCDKEIEE